MYPITESVNTVFRFRSWRTGAQFASGSKSLLRLEDINSETVRLRPLGVSVLGQ